MPPCKVDVYFLADNTGSMGPDLADIQATANDILDAIDALQNIDVQYGVGRYLDFSFIALPGPTAPYPIVEYGGNPTGFLDDTTITIAAGATATIPFAPGPNLIRGTWSGTTTVATEGSPVSSFSYGTGLFGSVRRTAYAQIHMRWTAAHGGGTVSTSLLGTSTITPSPLGTTVTTIQASTDITGEFSSCVWPTNGAVYGEYQASSFAGGALSIQVTNNLSVPIDILWKSVFRAANTAGGDTYCFQNQQAITPVRDNVTDQINEWITVGIAGGGDRAEGWVYALDKLINDPQGHIGWRDDSIRVIVQIGDNPGHTPICTTISGEASSIDYDTVKQQLVDAAMRWCGVSIIDSTTPFQRSGIDAQGGSAFGDTAYDFYCGGTQAFGPDQGTDLAQDTGGAIVHTETGTIVPDDIVNIVAEATLFCRRRRRIAQATLIGAT
jgi:hypothetical protein